MLTAAEEDRLYDALPSQYTVTWKGTTYGYPFTKWWDEEDHDIDYPELALGWNARSVQRDDDQPANGTISVDPKPGDPTVDIVKGHRVYDELRLTCSVGGDVNSDDIPAKVRAGAFADDILDFFRYGFDQNHEGANGERPVLARVVSEPVPASGLRDGDHSERYQMSVRLFYTDLDVQTEDAIDRVEGTIEIEGAIEDFSFD